MTNLEYDRTAPNLVGDPTGESVGIATKWNEHGLGECIVQFFDGSADSCIFTEVNWPNGEEAARKWLNDEEARRIG